MNNWMDIYGIYNLRNLGMRIGDGVLISRGATFVTHDVVIGDGCRIDHGALITGKIRIGRHVHIAAYVSLFGNGGELRIGSYTGISPYAMILTGTEDLSGLSGGPAMPDAYRAAPILADVVVGENCSVFARATLLPGARMGEGAVVASHSVLAREIPAYEIWGGVPAKYIKDRSLESAVILKAAS